MEGLNQFSKEIFEGNKSRGFHDKPQETGTYLMLMVSELGEALEADRKGKQANVKGFNGDLKNWTEGESGYDQRWKLAFESDIKDSHEDEIADTLIRILDYCGLKGIDIELHVREKLKYNAMRPNKHGKAY